MVLSLVKIVACIELILSVYKVFSLTFFKSKRHRFAFIMTTADLLVKQADVERMTTAARNCFGRFAVC